MCEERYSPRHQCKMKLLFKLEVYKKENAKIDGIEEEKIFTYSIQAEEELLSLFISLNTLVGFPSLIDFRTMRGKDTVMMELKIHI